MTTPKQLAALRAFYSAYQKALDHAKPILQEHLHLTTAIARKGEHTKDHFSIALEIRETATALARAGFDIPAHWLLVRWSEISKIVDQDDPALPVSPGHRVMLVCKAGDLKALNRVLSEISIEVFKGENQPPPSAGKSRTKQDPIYYIAAASKAKRLNPNISIGQFAKSIHVHRTTIDRIYRDDQFFRAVWHAHERDSGGIAGGWKTADGTIEKHDGPRLAIQKSRKIKGMIREGDAR